MHVNTNYLQVDFKNFPQIRYGDRKINFVMHV